MNGTSMAAVNQDTALLLNDSSTLHKSPRHSLSTFLLRVAATLRGSGHSTKPFG